MKKLLFSLTKKDFKVETFRSGGKGGQHQNTTDSGVRIRHMDSGAVGESREQKSQGQNKKIAFQRLVQSKEFQLWHKREVGRLTGQIPDIEKELDKAMRPENLRIESGIREEGEL